MSDDETFRRAFEHAPIGMAIVSLDGRMLRPNQALVDLVGFSRDELLFMEPEELAHPDDAGMNTQEMRRALDGQGDSYRVEKRWSNALGHTLWVIVSASLVRDEVGRPLYFIWHVEDGSMRKREEGRLQRMAHQDPLTGLVNRRRLYELLEHQVARAERYGEEAALLLLDLDGFKQVNDEHGHATGDELLRLVAQALCERVRESDVVARLGGDEFAVLLLNVNEDYARSITGELQRAVEQVELALDGTVVSPNVSLGHVMLTGAGDADELLAAADSAMYGEKRERAAAADGATAGEQSPADAEPGGRRFS